jgi:hypothetical protein
MAFTINQVMMTNLNVDLDSVESIDRAGRKTGGRIANRNNDTVLDNVLLGVIAERHIMLTGDTAADVAKSYGVAGGTVSKSRKLARVAVYNESVRGEDSPYDADTETRIARLQAFWSAEFEGRHIMSLASVLRDLVAEDGKDRASAIVSLVNCFGPSNRIDDVMEGRLVHPSLVQEQGDDDEQGGDEQGAGVPKVSGEELLTRGVRKCREQGMSDTDIAAFVMGLLGK